MSSFRVSIVTPEKVALQEEVDFLVVPGAEGEIGVLPGHAPLLAQLRAGELRWEKNQQVSFFAISGGFSEIHPDRVEVFAETAEMAEEIDIERARQAAERARASLQGFFQDPQEVTRAQAALRRALARLRTSDSLRRRRSTVRA